MSFAQVFLLVMVVLAANMCVVGWLLIYGRQYSHRRKLLIMMSMGVGTFCTGCFVLNYALTHSGPGMSAAAAISWFATGPGLMNMTSAFVLWAINRDLPKKKKK